MFRAALLELYVPQVDTYQTIVGTLPTFVANVVCLVR